MTIHKPEEARKFIVCPECEGHGHHGPGHVFTQEDRDDYDPQDWEDMMEDYRAGYYDVVCDNCKGARVVRDECACDECEETRRDLAEMDAQWRAEIAFGC